MRTPAPSNPRAARWPVHAVAALGNSVFLCFLTIALAHDRLFLASAPSGSPAPTALPHADERHARALVIVIDGLRADAAADAALMPNLGGLVARGRAGTARVESLIPSTVAGVIALTTGVTPPAASMLQDFRALPASHGGLLEQVRSAGGRSFVAGPPVWRDLYGRWIDEGTSLDLIVRSEDRPVVEATVRALRSDRFRLVVLHLGGPDDAAHVHGTQSREYRGAVRAADEALGRLLPLLRADDLVVVTADHGNTRAGGHAGPEADVRDVPFVAAGKRGVARRADHVVRQVDIARFIAASLALPWSTPTFHTTRSVAFPLTITLACCAAVPWIVGSLGLRREGRLRPTLVSAAVWITLPAAAFASRDIAVGLALAALAVTVRSLPRFRWRLSGPLACASGVGVALAVARLADGTGPTWTSQIARNASLALAIGAAYFLGRHLASRLRARPHHALGCGVAAVVFVVVAGRIAGQTLSLSTLDVRWAYPLAESVRTIPVAVVVVAIVQASPALALYVGIRPTLVRARPTTFVRFASGLGLVFAAQLATFSAALCCPSPHTASLAVGGLLRVASETISTFIPLAAAALAATARSRVRSDTSYASAPSVP